VTQSRPIEKIVHDPLILGHELVKLIHEYYAWHTPRVGVAEFPLKEIKRLCWTDANSLESFPEQDVRVVGVRNLHAVDLDKYEVLQFVRRNGAFEARNYFANGGRLSRARRAGNVDAVTGAIGNGLFEVKIDFFELVLPAGQTLGD